MTEKTAFIYCRVSTTDQRNSIENQEKDLKAYCKNKNIEVLGTFIDFGKSGKSAKLRPEFMKMMELIKAGENLPSMVLVTKLDRFARSLMDLYINVQLIVNQGVKFSTLQQDFDISTPIGKLQLGMLGLVAEFEREIINERSKEGFKAALDKGVICHRPRLDIPKKKVLELLSKDISASSIAKIYGVNTNTIKSRLNEWGYVYDSSLNSWVTRKEEQNF